MWFKNLTGLSDDSPESVREHLALDGTRLYSRKNGRSFTYGRLETPSLAELRKRVAALGDRSDARTTVREVVANVQDLHTLASSHGAVFQVASQFNLLEMSSPHVTPEQGVDVYDSDPTQGPACAVAAGAGTIYRNYFVRVDGRIGQSAENQLDCLADIGVALGNTDCRLWKMQNGYALPTPDGLTEVSARLGELSDHALDELRQKLRVGIQWNTEVTIDESDNRVTQVYCSALPVAYANFPTACWAPFARLVLDATYEATLCAAILNAAIAGNNRLFLTLVGGGVFGNDSGWIADAIVRALNIYKFAGLDVRIVSFRAPNSLVAEVVAALS